MVVNIARSFTNKAVVGDSSYDPATTIHPYVFNTAKMERILKLTLHSKVETTADIIADFAARGWLN